MLTKKIGEERAAFLQLIARNFVVSVWRGLLLVLRIGCIILLWHSLGLLYNFFWDYFCAQKNSCLHLNLS